MLRDLAADGYAVEVGGRWRPLFTGNDPEINDQILARLDAVDPKSLDQALALRETARNP